MPSENNGEGVRRFLRFLDTTLVSTPSTYIAPYDIYPSQVYIRSPHLGKQIHRNRRRSAGTRLSMYLGQYQCDLEVKIPKRRSKAYLPSQIPSSGRDLEPRLCLPRHSNCTRGDIGFFVSFFESPNADNPPSLSERRDAKYQNTIHPFQSRP